jgi:hypothetical protein
MALRKGVERRELHQRVVVIWDSDYTRNEKARFAAIARRFIVGRVMGRKSAGREGDVSVGKKADSSLMIDK